jgi:hypothetical protein
MCNPLQWLILMILDDGINKNKFWYAKYFIDKVQLIISLTTVVNRIHVRVSQIHVLFCFYQHSLCCSLLLIYHWIYQCLETPADWYTFYKLSFIELIVLTRYSLLSLGRGLSLTDACNSTVHACIHIRHNACTPSLTELNARIYTGLSIFKGIFVENLCIIYRRKTAYDKITFLIDTGINIFLFRSRKAVYSVFKKKRIGIITVFFFRRYFLLVRLTAVGIRWADHVTPSTRKSQHYFADSGGRSVGIVRLRTKATEFNF